MFDDGRDIAMQRFLFDVACLIGAFFAISQNRKNLIRRHEQLHAAAVICDSDSSGNIVAHGPILSQWFRDDANGHSV